MNLYGYEIQRESDIIHYGIKGMHWGVRRYQNPDGSLTALGRAQMRESYNKAQTRSQERAQKKLDKYHEKEKAKAAKQAEKEAKINKRYQNEDGSLNATGKLKLLKETAKLDKLQSRARKMLSSTFWSRFGTDITQFSAWRANRYFNKLNKKYGKMHISAFTDSQKESAKDIYDKLFIMNETERYTQKNSRRYGQRRHKPGVHITYSNKDQKNKNT